MKVPSDRRASADQTHYAPYPTGGQGFSQPAPPQPRTSRPSPLATPTPLPDAQPTYKVARAISSCTRCRSRKQKCDGKLPACSACERAKVECIGFDAISKTNVSRKWVQKRYS